MEQRREIAGRHADAVSLLIIPRWWWLAFHWIAVAALERMLRGNIKSAPCKFMPGDVLSMPCPKSGSNESDLCPCGLPDVAPNVGRSDPGKP